MSFVSGQLITASELNTTNGNISRSYSWGHAGWSWSNRYAYWYCTRDSGTHMMTQSNSTSTGNQKILYLYRLENGSWVQKAKSDTASGTKTISWNSFGLGAYYLRINDHNNTPSLTIYPCKTNNVKGNLLFMLSVSPCALGSESELIAASPRSHDFITADYLNQGRVYTG